MTYFKNVDTLESLRRQYKELLKKFHPDNPNGSTAACQEINAEYDKLFKQLKNKHESKQTSTARTKESYSNMHYDFAEDKAIREMLQKIIFFSNITIDIVGRFIWIDGNTYQYRNEFKTLGFKWSAQRKKWYWHNGEYKKHRNSNLSYADIQNKYGSTEVKTEQRILLQA